MTFALSDDPLPVLTAADVARLLHKTEEQFLRQVRGLTRDHGFPRHLPGICRRWSRAQVLAWINANGQVLIAPAQTPAELTDIVRQAEADLAARYGAGQ